MEITCTTKYDQKTVTAMARGLRKTIRKKRSRRSHVFGWIVTVLAVLLPFLTREEGESLLTFRAVVTWLVALGLVAVLIWEDQINGYFARKRMLPGMSDTVTVFTREGYTTTTPVGETRWTYDNIGMIGEDRDYFVFVFSQSHAQVYGKSGLSGADVEQFRAFLGEVTGKEIQVI